MHGRTETSEIRLSKRKFKVMKLKAVMYCERSSAVAVMMVNVYGHGALW